MPTMRNANTTKAPRYCLRTWYSCSTSSATGSWCASSMRIIHLCAHSEHWRSVRGCGKSHNRRTMAGQPAADAYACPEWRRRREQQHKCALSCRELSPRSCFTSRLRSLPGRGAKFAYGCVRYQSTSASSSLRHRGDFSRLRSQCEGFGPRGLVWFTRH